MPGAVRAVQTHLDATGRAAGVEPGLAPGVHRVRFAVKGEPLVSMVIPSACRPVKFRDRDSWFVLECVSSIRRMSTYKNVEIIVIDNNDMSEELWAKLQPLDVVRVHFTEAFNLTRKINLGASHAKGEQLLLLNDDVEVITPGWIEAMLEFSQQPEIGAVGVQLLFPDDAQQHTGVVILDGNPRHPFYREPRDHPGYFYSSIVHRDCAAVTGACTMTRREVFEAVGGYSERFPLSYNDIDYCLKVLELGNRVVYTPYAKLYHHESVSRPLTKPEHVKGFKEYWLGRFPRDPYYNANLGRHFRVRVG
jgi:GT2 family glycosyltransferase